MDNGGFRNERDADYYYNKAREETIKQLQREVEDWKLKYETLVEILRENKFEEQNKKLRTELGWLNKKLKDQEKEYEEKIKIDEIERKLLDYIYPQAEIAKYKDSMIGLYRFRTEPIYFNLIFDDMIKEYFIKKGVKEE